MSKTLFLPGASGSASFWKPVAARAELNGVFFAWPGLGVEPPQQGIDGVDDLIALVASEITEPVNIVAQSMGGLIAIRLALSLPHLVKRLVLAATSGGVPVADLGGSDWRPDYFAAFPGAASWIAPIPSATYRTKSGPSRRRHCFCGVMQTRSVLWRSANAWLLCSHPRAYAFSQARIMTSRKQMPMPLRLR